MRKHCSKELFLFDYRHLRLVHSQIESLIPKIAKYSNPNKDKPDSQEFTIIHETNMPPVLDE